MGMAEKESKTSKPGISLASGISEQIEGLWENLGKTLPPDLLKVAAMSNDDITRRNQAIFGSLEISLSAEQKAKIDEQGHLKVEDLTAEQREVLKEGIHLHWARSLLQPPPFIEDLDSFNIEFGNYADDGKRYFRIFRPHPDGGQTSYQTSIEV